MKKVCLIKWNLNTFAGGDKVAVNLANELSKRHKVYLLSINPIDNIKFKVDEKVSIEELFRKRIYQKNMFKIAAKLRKFLSENKIDVAMNIGLAPNIALCLSTINMREIKKIFCEHTNLKNELDSHFKKYQRWIATKFFNNIVVLTEQDKIQYIEKYNIKDKVIRIYNWMENFKTSCEYNTESKKIVTIGRFSEEKGYDLLSNIAKNVLSIRKDWTWEIYGDGDEDIKNRLENELKNNGVLDQVIFRGVTSNQKDMYFDKSIYAMTSKYEGLPLVLLEAKNYKLPIISFDCTTGPRDIIKDKENGFLITPYDIDEYTKKLLNLIDDKVLRESLSKKSLLDTEKFKKEVIIEQWFDLIEKV